VILYPVGVHLHCRTGTYSTNTAVRVKPIEPSLGLRPPRDFRAHLRHVNTQSSQTSSLSGSQHVMSIRIGNKSNRSEWGRYASSVSSVLSVADSKPMNGSDNSARACYVGMSPPTSAHKKWDTGRAELERTLQRCSTVSSSSSSLYGFQATNRDETAPSPPRAQTPPPLSSLGTWHLERT
jgi:hypothetical protein